MVEELLINKMLQEKSLKPMKEQGIKVEQFLTCDEEIKFIIDHFQTYGVVPDRAVFAGEFRDFEIVDVAESDEYLGYKIKEASLYKDLVPVLKEAGDKVRDDSVTAIQFLKEQIDKLLKSGQIKTGKGYDIMANAEDRLEEYKKRVDTEGLLGISTGIKLLDEYLHGWIGEDLVTIFARTNMGKSWILLYFLTVAWKLGNRVLLYSGEMSRHIVGFRVDTINEHFSNMGLMNGNKEMMEAYSEYVKMVAQKDGFIVVTPKDLGGEKPTVDELKNLAVYYHADIIGVDQITLMKDQRKGENKRIQFTNISEDLMLMSEELQKPVLALTQARRENGKKKEEKDNAPELDEIYESDGIAQNSTRVISFIVIDKVLKLNIKKNRYGLNNREVLLHWDIDKGIIKPLLEGGLEQNDFGF